MLLILGIAGIIAGIILVAIPVGFLQAAGGALLGTSLSLISSTVAGKQAVHQQYAKEANIARKNESYVPLHDELIRLHDLLEEAHAGKQPYPRWIEGADKSPEFARYQHTYNPATFAIWPEFKNNTHIQDFSKEACSTLDEVLHLASEYNAAIARTHEPSYRLLTPHIAKSLQELTKATDYQEYEQQQQAGTRTMQQGDEYFSWIANNIKFLAPGTVMGYSNALDWIEHNGALEWLIAGHIDEAATCVYRAYRLHMSRPPELTWIQGILLTAWSELDRQSTYHETRDTLEHLLNGVGKAKKKLEDGLLYIRDTYEGGAPPV